jgi:phospholipid/cholesterol/gamma-HCH transport system substrate-binding protein
MDDRTVKFRVGVVMIATPLIGAILFALFGGFPTLGQGAYPLYVQFKDAPGVSEGTPVRKSGILIGRVSATEFAQKRDGVIVTLKIQDKVQLHRNEICRIKGGFLGDAVLEFIPVDDKALEAQLISPGDYLNGTVMGNPLEALANMESNLSAAAGSVGKAGDQIGELAGNLNKMFSTNDDQIQRILDKTESSLDGLQRTLGNVDGVLGDQQVQQQLRQSIVELPELFKQSRDTLDRMQDAIESANRNMHNMEGLTGPLGDRGEQMVTKIDSTMGRLDELLAQFVMFGKQLNEENGSLNRLVRDPELYQSLNQAAKNVEQITCELKPIVRDARAFSDKVARHPEVLGVGGAIRRSSGIK